VQPAMLDVDPTTSLWFPSYVLHGVNVGFVYDSLMQCTPTGLSDNSCFIFSSIFLSFLYILIGAPLLHCLLPPLHYGVGDTIPPCHLVNSCH
jgi:hypothetical protein